MTTNPNIEMVKNAIAELEEIIPEFRQGMNREEEIIGSLMTIILAAKNIAHENRIDLPRNI